MSAVILRVSELATRADRENRARILRTCFAENDAGTKIGFEKSLFDVCKKLKATRRLSQ